MFFLFDIPFDDLKGMPSFLWAKPVDCLGRCEFIFNVIGSVKYFHKEDVSFIYWMIFLFYLILM